ncbi:hypothetical protein Ari01nite_96040 [Paractinoplanes rishiriensis]|uniref:Uncharacterized protein n=1 Tax=Paractinoplanes rishiriensis TaxID=1050105 RepID=A0A919KB80_9ACTN|nr:hypothetical protein Ari01nite_96040 [Actinoplanes rishiriensis]
MPGPQQHQHPAGLPARETAKPGTNGTLVRICQHRPHKTRTKQLCERRDIRHRVRQSHVPSLIVGTDPNANEPLHQPGTLRHP